MTTPTTPAIEEANLKSYKIEYEIPPLRAIYNVIADKCHDESEAEQALLKAHPNARVRKIREVNPHDYPEYK